MWYGCSIVLESMDTKTNDFWSAASSYSVVTRRLLFKRGSKSCEIEVSIAPDRAVQSVNRLAGAALDAVITTARSEHDAETIAVDLVYAEIGASKEGAPLVTTADHREIPVSQFGMEHAVKQAYDIETMMSQAKAALPTAAVAPGDHAVGFIYRGSVLHFYPVLVLSLPEDVDTFRDGFGMTDDVIPLLPFQS